MAPDLPAIHKAQIWAHRTREGRRFLVIEVRDDRQVYGWSYHERGSSTRDKTLDPYDLTEDYVLLEDVPERLRAVSRG